MCPVPHRRHSNLGNRWTWKTACQGSDGPRCVRPRFLTARGGVGMIVADPDLARPSTHDRGHRREGHPRLANPRRDVLLLDRRHHVADPRGLHGLRGGCRATQEHHVDGDEEHPHHRRRHADVLLLRLVHLRLLPGGLAEGRPQQPDGRRARDPRGPVPEQRSLGGPDGPESARPHHRRLLPRLPPLLVDDRVDHVRSAHRARATVGLPDLTALLGSAVWIMDAAWGWSSGGWLVTRFGFHDRSRLSSSTESPGRSPSECC